MRTLEQGPIEEVPPLEAYAEEPHINGHAKFDEKPHEESTKDDGGFKFAPVAELFNAGKAPEFVVDGLFETHSVVGVVAPPESGKSLLMQEIAVCVASGRHFHGRKVRRGLVVYLVGEGLYGLRARFQALDSRYGFDGDVLPLVVSLCATSLIMPAELWRVDLAIAAQEKHWGMPLTLLIIDTLARFMGGGDESKAQDMGAYLAAIDMLRREAAAVSLHHPGHGDSTRGRGSSSWKAGLDAEYSIAQAEGNITVTCQKMKDGAKPQPFSFKIVPAPTKMCREDGTPVTSVLLEPTDSQVTRKPISGKNQKTMLAALEAVKVGPGVWTEKELRDIGKEAGLNRFQARDSILGLRQLGYLIHTVGGSRLAT